MSYLGEDKEKSLKYFEDSYSLFKQVGDKTYEKEVRYNLDFAKIYLGEILPEDSDESLKNFKCFLNLLHCNYFKNHYTMVQKKIFLYILKALFLHHHTEYTNAFKNSFYNQIIFTSLVAKEILNRGDNSKLIKSMVGFKGNIEEGAFADEKTDFYNLSCINSIHCIERIYRTDTRQLQEK